MYWFWIHTLFSVIFGVLFLGTAHNGYRIYSHKEMFSFTALPSLMKKHLYLGYGFATFALLSLLSGEMVASWQGWYVNLHKFVPVLLIPALILACHSGMALKKCNGSRPLFHCFILFVVCVLSAIQFFSGAVMLGLVWWK